MSVISAFWELNKYFGIIGVEMPQEEILFYADGSSSWGEMSESQPEPALRLGPQKTLIDLQREFLNRWIVPKVEQAKAESTPATGTLYIGLSPSVSDMDPSTIAAIEVVGGEYHVAHLSEVCSLHVMVSVLDEFSRGKSAYLASDFLTSPLAGYILSSTGISPVLAGHEPKNLFDLTSEVLESGRLKLSPAIDRGWEATLTRGFFYLATDSTGQHKHIYDTILTLGIAIQQAKLYAK